MKIVDGNSIILTEGTSSPVEVIRDIVDAGMQEDSFYVMDVGEVVARYQRWKELMPRVTPFFAVKSNDHKLQVSILAALGASFDCASKAEIELVTSLGVKPERIIFAHTAKMVSHIRYASAVGVNCMTFDSESELDKVKQIMPHAQLVIRIRCDAKCATSPLGHKFGCNPITEAPHLLEHAASLGLQVVGVAFHVGSGAMETEAFARGIELCRKVFDMASSIGHTRMRLLDLGGGFPGEIATELYEASQVINTALEKHFPSSDVRVMAEPGRYFSVAAYTLAACVHSKREVKPKNTDKYGDTHTMYFINDGVYGSFNCVISTREEVTAEVLNPRSETLLPCSLWGPTLKGLDCVVPITQFPALQVGDWVLFRNMGAYTLTLASEFNGFSIPKVCAFVDSKVWSLLKDLQPLTSMQLTFKKRYD